MSAATPTPAEIRALLEQSALTPYAAAPLARVTARQMQRAAIGASALSPSAWRLLQVTLSASARKELPVALVK